MPQVNWDKVKEEYIYGYINEQGVRVFPSYDDLSKKYGVAKSTIYRNSVRDNWGIEKEMTRNRLHTKRTQMVEEVLVNEDVKFNKVLFQATQLMSHYVLLKLANIVNNKITGVNTKLPIDDAKKLGDILEKAQEIGTNALGTNAFKSNTPNNIDKFYEMLKEYWND